MKVKTSLTLSEELLRRVDCRADGNRSGWIERVIRDHLKAIERRERDEADERVFAGLRARGAVESDVLDYSAPIPFEEPDAPR